jgi:prevent-host-death family protein
MADRMNIHAAKTNFSKLVEQAEHGKTIIIQRDGRPVAQLGPLPEDHTELPPRQPGAWAGKLHIPEDFDAYDAEIERLFYESRLFPPDEDQS